MPICRHYQASMRMPVSVIVGEEDYAAPVAMSEQIQKAVPGCHAFGVARMSAI